ncbi:hypothetical protein BSLG_002352 [Batrachochytrium salamandrivorans]|nr:hypothetical protein BSLG_002352 [Batrachochytrium salamandrivorans]
MTTDPAKSKHHAAVLALSSCESVDQVRQSVRFIKNVIIGNPTKKDLYLHELMLAPSILECLRNYSSHTDLCTEISMVIASLANGGDLNVTTLVAAGAIPPLLDTLSSHDLKLVDAGVRALRSIVQHPSFSNSSIFESTHIKALTTLVSDTMAHNSSLAIHIAEVAASILARIAECSTVARDLIFDTGVVVSLFKWLDPKWAVFPRVQEAVLDILARLCYNNPVVAKTIASALLHNEKRLIDIIFALVRDKRPSMRFAASTCYQSSILVILLPTIIRLFGNTSLHTPGLGASSTTIGEHSLPLFAELVSESAELQSAAIEADAIFKLAHIINSLIITDTPIDAESDALKRTKSSMSWGSLATSQTQTSNVLNSISNTRQLESAFLAIANVCSLREECRRQVIDAKLLPHIVTALGHSSVSVRKNACKCARSLSRSVKTLRTSLMDVGLAPPLFELLFDENIDVQIEASATLCNIVLDFSPMKKIVLEKGGIKRLVELLDQSESSLRRNALWALKNMLFQADSSTKTTVMQHLGWDKLLKLLDDEDIIVQEQALNLLRNAACGNEQDVEAVFNGFCDADILGLLERKLEVMAHSPDTVIQTLYIVVNLAIGGAERKSAVMSRMGLLRRVFDFLEHENTQIRLASVWCAINLTWIDDAGAKDRVVQLSSLGIESRLRRLLDDENLDVKDRAKTALANIEGPIPSSEESLLSSSDAVPESEDSMAVDRIPGALI